MLKQISLVLLGASYVLAQSMPTNCTYEDGVFECDYSAMGALDRPISYTAFGLVPQRIVLSVNDTLPYTGTYNSIPLAQSPLDRIEVCYSRLRGYIFQRLLLA